METKDNYSKKELQQKVAAQNEEGYEEILKIEEYKIKELGKEIYFFLRDKAPDFEGKADILDKVGQFMYYNLLSEKSQQYCATIQERNSFLEKLLQD